MALRYKVSVFLLLVLLVYGNHARFQSIQWRSGSNPVSWTQSNATLKRSVLECLSAWSFSSQCDIVMMKTHVDGGLWCRCGYDSKHSEYILHKDDQNSPSFLRVFKKHIIDEAGTVIKSTECPRCEDRSTGNMNPETKTPGCSTCSDDTRNPSLHKTKCKACVKGNINANNHIKNKQKKLPGSSVNWGISKPKTSESRCQCSAAIPSGSKKKHLYAIQELESSRVFRILVYNRRKFKFDLLDFLINGTDCRRVAIDGCTLYYCMNSHQIGSMCMDGTLKGQVFTAKGVITDVYFAYGLLLLNIRFPPPTLVSIHTDGTNRKKVRKFKRGLSQFQIDTRVNQLLWTGSNNIIYSCTYNGVRARKKIETIAETDSDFGLKFTVCPKIYLIVVCEQKNTSVVAHNYYSEQTLTWTLGRYTHCEDVVCLDNKIYVDVGENIYVFNKYLKPLHKQVKKIANPWAINKYLTTYVTG